MTDEEFVKLRKQNAIELNLTEDNIKEKILQAPLLKAKYYNLYIKEKRVLDELEQRQNALYSKWMKYYKFRGKHPITGEECPFVVNTQKELDYLIYSNEECNNLLIEYDKQKDVVEYIKTHLKHISEMGFTFNQYLDYQKLRQGMQ